MGRAPAAAAVAVNGTTLGAQHRTGEVFHFQLPLVSNANSPVWLPASVSSQGTTIDRHFFVPKQVTAPQHDLDGNLVNDGRWVYLWDAENRLIQMESTVAAVQAGAPYRKLVFHYDAGGRRLAKTVYHGTAAAPVFASSTRWLYDGWNPISEFSGTADTGGMITRTKSYTWGPDLSGTPQGAGGVGGLLAVIVHSGFTNSAYYPSYDGNGNLVAWTLEGTPAPVSRREYDAFGNTLVEEGVSPSAYGFSTKMQDAETGLYYDEYRFYDPVTGRWLSNDFFEEIGGLLLRDTASFLPEGDTGPLVGETYKKIIEALERIQQHLEEYDKLKTDLRHKAALRRAINALQNALDQIRLQGRLVKIKGIAPYIVERMYEIEKYFRHLEIVGIIREQLPDNRWPVNRKIRKIPGGKILPRINPGTLPTEKIVRRAPGRNLIDRVPKLPQRILVDDVVGEIKGVSGGLALELLLSSADLAHIYGVAVMIKLKTACDKCVASSDDILKARQSECKEVCDGFENLQNKLKNIDP